MLGQMAMPSRSLWPDSVSSSRSSHQLDRLRILYTLRDVSEYFYSRAVARVLWQSLRQWLRRSAYSMALSWGWVSSKSFVSITVDGQHMGCLDASCSIFGDWGLVGSFVGFLPMDDSASSCGQLWGWYAPILVWWSSLVSSVISSVMSCWWEDMLRTVWSNSLRKSITCDANVDMLASNLDALSFAVCCSSSCCWQRLSWSCWAWDIARILSWTASISRLRRWEAFSSSRILVQHCVVALCPLASAGQVNLLGKDSPSNSWRKALGPVFS